jgi:hypothetical protein
MFLSNPRAIRSRISTYQPPPHSPLVSAFSNHQVQSVSARLLSTFRPVLTSKQHSELTDFYFLRDAKICFVVKSRPVQSRRRLHTDVRKRITSYYTEQEQQTIAAAAATLRVSISGFVANAALAEANRVIRAKTVKRK